MIKQPEIKVKKEFVENIFTNAIGDKEILPVVMKLHNRVNVSEFDIAKRLKMNINDVRNILYKLNERNLIFSTRKKDKQKGWYIYFWTLNLKNIKMMFENHQMNKINELRNTVQKEQETDYFKCPEGCSRMSSADILHYDYMCPECGTLMTHDNNTTLVHSLKKQISHMEQDLAEAQKVEVPIIDLRDIEKEMRKRIKGKGSTKSLKARIKKKKRKVKKKHPKQFKKKVLKKTAKKKSKKR